MANTIQHKRSSTSGSAPLAGDLSAGELALNTADGSIYMKNSAGTVIQVAQNLAAMNTDIAMNSNKVTGLADPTSNQDAATKAYVDSQLSSDLSSLITVTDGSNSTTLGDGDTLTFSGTANEVTVAESSGTITIGLPDSITADVTGDVTGNADTASAWATARTITLGGDLTGNVSIDGSANVTLTATVAANSVALGTDTSGNYVATIAGTSNEITVSGSGSETAAVTIGLPDDVTITNDLSVGNDLTVTGNLTVSGTTTTVNTETINLADNIILINSNEAGAPSQNGGIEVERGTSTNVTLVWDETADKWTVGSETFVAATFEGALTGNVTGDVTGNADTATALETARTIGGVSFDGSANINLPGVNTAGNQNTSGNAATATALATARTIGGVSFDGSANINLPGVNTAGNQNTSGNAATATKWATARTITLGGDLTGSVSIDGSANVTLTAAVVDDSHNHVTGDIDGLAEYIADTVGAMVTSNTESGISVTYDDADNTLDFNVNDPTITLTGAVTGSATMTNLGNVSITTTATSDPTITLAGDLSGSCTLTNLGSATLTATIADDSHNHTIANVDGLQAALDLKAPLASPALTGTPTAPTALAATNNTTIATTAYVTTAISNLIGGAPAALDTLNELAAAINDDASYASTITTALGTKVATNSAQALSSAANAMTGSNATITLARGDSTTDVVTVNNVANANACSGNAATATALATARTIGGVSFNGTANINLPGVNTAGNQNTSGNAATATTATNATNLYINNDDTGDTNCPILFSANTTAGYKAVYEDSALYFDNTNNTLYSTIFSGTATAARYADLAEKYAADADIEPGTVVCFGGDAEVTTCMHDMDRKVAGVVSTDPAYMMNSEAEGVYVALTGRVPCKVVGPVRKGDMMVSAGNGAARAEENPVLGSVIGKALEDFDGAEGVIEVVVGRL